MIPIFRKASTILALLLLCSSIFPCISIAQNTIPDEAVPDSSVVWLISTNDDNEFFGTLIQRTDTHIELQTEALGLISIPIERIRKMERIRDEQIVDGLLWAENPQSTRYFLSPNGFGLRAGEGYYQNVWIFFNQFAFGVSNNFSLGFGLVPTFLFASDEIPVWITPRVSIPLSGAEGIVNLGVSAFAGTVLGVSEGGFGVLSGSLSVGTRDRNLSIGLGYFYADSEFAEQPAITVSGMFRLGRRGYVMAETFFVDSESLILVGFRTVGRNLSFDYGLLTAQGSDGVFIPWLSVSVPFGN